MERFLIKGGHRLEGEVSLDGAKNSALKVLIAATLADEKVKLYNMPTRMKDVQTKIEMLRNIGAKVTTDGDEVTINGSSINNSNLQSKRDAVPRTSLLLLGSLLGKFGEAKVPLPGGDDLGERKHNLHIYALKCLGAEVKETSDGYLEAKCASSRLSGAEIKLNFPSVGATENSIISSCLARGTTIIRNAAKEPEIVDLANLLNSMGAKIRGVGTNTIVITGVRKLRGTEFTIIPDRMQAGTYMVAAAITHGEFLIKNGRFDHLKSLVAKLREIGIEISHTSEGICVKGSNKFRSTDIITQVYPGFPTDMQPVATPLLSLANGRSTIKETVYKYRFNHVEELKKMGAKIKVVKDTAFVTGVKRLEGAKVMATDLRAGAALVIAGLAAHNRTEISNVYEIDRGYEQIEEKLRNLGADIERVTD